MVVKQIGNRWHPVGKKGPWKSSYPTKTSAEKALRSANKYFGSKNTKKKSKSKSTGGKKPTKRKKSTKTRGSSSKKPKGGKKVSKTSLLQIARGVVIGGAAVAPGAAFFQARTAQGASGFKAFTDTVLSYGGRNYSTGKFDWGVFFNRVGPVAVVNTLDNLASRTGFYKKLGRLLRF